MYKCPNKQEMLNHFLNILLTFYNYIGLNVFDAKTVLVFTNMIMRQKSQLSYPFPYDGSGHEIKIISK